MGLFCKKKQPLATIESFSPWFGPPYRGMSIGTSRDENSEYSLYLCFSNTWDMNALWKTYKIDRITETEGGRFLIQAGSQNLILERTTCGLIIGRWWSASGTSSLDFVSAPEKSFDCKGVPEFDRLAPLFQKV
jgi:hypothetical protein